MRSLLHSELLQNVRTGKIIDHLCVHISS
jgi:hypothetical protein